MQVHVDRSVHTAVRESTIQIRTLQQEFYSKLSTAVGIVAPPFLVDTCKDSSASADVRLENVCMPGSSAPRSGSPAEVAEMAKDKSEIGDMPFCPGATVPGARSW